MEKLDKKKFLSNCFLFKQLTTEELDKMANMAGILRVKKNSLLFFQGDQACAFYIIIYGKLCIYRNGPSGEEQILHIHTDRDLVAEAAIFDQTVYPANCKVVKDSVVLRIPKDSFLEQIICHPQISLKFLQAYSKRLREFVTKIEYLTLNDIKQRLIKFIIQNSKRNEKTMQYEFDLTMTKKELSGLLGTIPETLSRNLTFLKKKRLIEEVDKKIIITNMEEIKTYL